MNKILLIIVSLTLFAASSVYSYYTRGYFALGGELVFLLAVPVLWAILDERRKNGG